MKNHALTLALLCLSSSLFSQVFVKSNANGANDGSSWANAYHSLSDAIVQAAQGDEVWVAAGTYKAGETGADPATTHFYLDKNISLYGGFAGNEISLTDRDVAANVTTLSGDLAGDDVPNDFMTNRSDNAYHVLLLSENSEGAMVNGFTIVSGNTKEGTPPNDDDFLDWAGGGILSLSTSNIQHCTFEQNGGWFGSAMSTSGGTEVLIADCIFSDNYSTRGTLGMEGHMLATVKNCEFSHNTAIEFGGAATIGNTNANIIDCSFTNNICLEEAGGGLFVFQNNETLVENTEVTITTTSFSGNTAPNGGGLAYNNFSSNSQLMIDGCTFDDNEAEGEGGGFVIRNINGDFGANYLTTTILNTSSEGNKAEDGGGGIIYCRDFTLTLEMEGCDFINNESENNGGGLEVHAYGAGIINANINDVLFKENISEITGGGLSVLNENEDNRIHISLSDCVFEKNTTTGFGAGLATHAPTGGSLMGPVSDIVNCTFINNAAESCCGGIFASASILNVSDSYFEGNSTASDFIGGGGIGMMDNEFTLIERSVFHQNTSEEEGAAIYQSNGQNMVSLDNIVFSENDGESAIYAEDSLTLRNVSMLANTAGLAAMEDAEITFQNSIFADSGDNLLLDGDVDITSMGGNLSNDFSMVDELEGSGAYIDQHGLSPMLNSTDYTPQMGSPCVDMGNPEGIDADALDAAGEMRIQGTGIDIGAIESAFNLTAVTDRELAASVSVYPNPFVATLNIDTEEQPQAIHLYDVNGKIIGNLPTGETQIAVDNQLVPGSYFLDFIFENGTTRKIVVKE